MGAGVGEQLEHLEKAQELIERGPVAFLAAALFLYALLVTGLWVRAVLRVEKLQRAHAREDQRRDAAHSERLDQLQRNHWERIDEMQREALERGIRLEHLVQGVLRLVQFGGEVVAAKEPEPKKRRKRTTNPGLASGPEAPTLVLGQGEVDDED